MPRRSVGVLCEATKSKFAHGCAIWRATAAVRHLQQGQLPACKPKRDVLKPTFLLHDEQSAMCLNLVELQAWQLGPSYCLHEPQCFIEYDNILLLIMSYVLL